jgi:hypothetical protein
MPNSNCPEEKIPQLTNNINGIALTAFDRDDLTIPVEFYSVNPDIRVNLELQKNLITVDGLNQQTTTDVKKRWTLSRQANKVNSLFVFSRVLTKKDLPEIGFYTGNIAEFELPSSSYIPNKDINQPNSFRSVSINIEPSPLSRLTSFKDCNGFNNLSIADMVEQIYTTLLVRPIGGVRQRNGTYQATYDFSCKQITPTYSLTDRNGGVFALPQGSFFTLIDKKTNQSVKGFSGIMLHQTNQKGFDPVTGEDISGDGFPCSFIHLHNLPKGEYQHFATYVNKNGVKQNTDIQDIYID